MTANKQPSYWSQLQQQPQVRAFSNELLLVGLWHRVCIPSNKKKDKVLWKEQPPLIGGKLSYIEEERDAANMKACLVRFRRIRRSFVRNLRNSVFCCVVMCESFRRLLWYCYYCCTLVLLHFSLSLSHERPYSKKTQNISFHHLCNSR